MPEPVKRLEAKRAHLGTWFNRDDWQERIISFNASWYTATMGTGIIVQVLFNFPYNAIWERDLAYCFWVLTMVLFIFFTILSIVRAILHPNLTRDILKDFYQTSFLGCIPITIDAIAVGFVLFYGELEGTVWFAYALYWVAVFLSILVGGIVVWLVTAIQEAPKLSSVNGIWLLSFIPLLVTAATGGTITPHLPIEARGATLIVSFLLWSVGVAMTMVITVIYFWRLVQYKLPVRDAIVSCFIPMGPPGMAAYGIANLASAMNTYITSTSFNLQRPNPPVPPYSNSADQAGRAYHVAEGSAVHWMGILLALFFIAFATFWLIQAVLSVFHRVPKQFSVGHWSFVFPNGVYCNGLSVVSKDLNNKGLRGWAAAISVITILLWVYCAVSTFYKGVWRGELFFAPGLEGWNEHQAMDQERQRRKSVMLVEKPGPSTPDAGVNTATHATGHLQSAGDAEMLADHRPDGTFSKARERKSRPNGAENV